MTKPAFRPKPRHRLKCRKCKTSFESTGDEAWCWPCFAAWRASASDGGASVRMALERITDLESSPGGREIKQVDTSTLPLVVRPIRYTDLFPSPGDPADILFRRRAGRVRIK